MAALISNASVVAGSTYHISFRITDFAGSDGTAAVSVYQGTQFVYSAWGNGVFSDDFVADASGNSITFLNIGTLLTAKIDSVTLKKVDYPATNSNYSLKEFLSGQTDEGMPIFFRADTQFIQLSKNFETFSNPLAVVSRTQKGTLLKCFVAIDDGSFYELEGTANKGVSIVKVHSNGRRKIPTPPITRKMRVSWRDGSRQLCRLIQGAIVFTPGTMDYSE